MLHLKEIFEATYVGWKNLCRRKDFFNGCRYNPSILSPSFTCCLLLGVWAGKRLSEGLRVSAANCLVHLYQPCRPRSLVCSLLLLKSIPSGWSRDIADPLLHRSWVVGTEPAWVHMREEFQLQGQTFFMQDGTDGDHEKDPAHPSPDEEIPVQCLVAEERLSDHGDALKRS